MNFHRFSYVRLIGIVVFTYVFFVFGIIWADTFDTPTNTRIDLTESQVWLRSGLERDFSVNPETRTDLYIDLTGKPWSIFKTAFAEPQPIFSVQDLPVQFFSYVINFDIPADKYNYMREHSMVPGLYIDAIADNWEIFVNGNSIKREFHLTMDEIEYHRNVTAISIPFDKGYLREGMNQMVVHIAVNPNVQDAGIYFSNSCYIDDFDSLQVGHNDFFLIFFTGISFFMGFYNLLIFANNRKDRGYLYFALGAFLLAGYIFMNTSSINLIVADSQTVKHIEFITLTIMPVSVVLFTKFTAQEKITLPFKILCVFQLIIAVSFLFVGIQCSIDLLKLSEGLVLVSLFYSIVTALRWIRRAIKSLSENRKSRLASIFSVIFGTVMGNTLIGLLIVTTAAQVGIIRSNLLETEQNVVIIGLFSFVIAVSFALQNEVSETKRYIANQNEILEEMVEVRTHDLEKQTEFAVRASNTKSRFLATMSHEIRTPMNAIIGISEIQLAREDIAENTREAITKIHHSGQGLLAIINDILDLSKAESGKLEITPQTYEFASMINDTVLLNIGRIGSKPVTFTMEIAKGIPDKLIGDELRVKQILNNILSNAFKYTDSGNVQLIMTFERKADTVTLTITISDTGSGMREEEVKLLFDEYSRFNKFANRKTEGTGLGMNITGQLVKLMNGEIKVQSRFGKGSTFTVTLPQGLPEGAGELPEEIRERLCNFTYTEAGKHMKRRYEYMPYGKVLVVDDVDTNLYVAEGLMSPYGLKIKKAINGFEAVKFIEAGEEYDLIFMDHMMPEMDGVETVKRIREMGYTKPIAALTANALVGSEQFFAENGFDDFISKPIDVRDLDRILCRFVRDMNPEKAAMYKNRAKGNVHEQPSKKTDPKFAAVFVKDAKKAYRELEENSDNLEKIVIAAHSMKSACANIGETEVSKAAMILETAAREHDEVTVKELFDDFLLKLSEVIAKKEFESAKSKETAAESDIPAADPVEIAETFRALRMALDDYDEQTAEQILQKLLSMGLSESEREKVQAVSDMLFHSDFESAIDILG